jgi:hypothetical protein
MFRLDEAGQSTSLSEEKRTAGNAAFSKKQDLAALKLYTEAIFAAPTRTEEGRREAALGLANRSAVWFKEGERAYTKISLSSEHTSCAWFCAGPKGMI